MRPLDKDEEQRLEIRSKQYQNVFETKMTEKAKSKTVGSISESLEGDKEKIKKSMGKAVIS